MVFWAAQLLQHPAADHRPDMLRRFPAFENPCARRKRLEGIENPQCFDLISRRADTVLTLCCLKVRLSVPFCLITFYRVWLKAVECISGAPEGVLLKTNRD